MQDDQYIKSKIRRAIDTTIIIAKQKAQQISQFAQEHKIAIGTILGFITLVSIANNLSFIQHDLIGDGILRNLPDHWQNFVDKNIVEFTTTTEAKEAANKAIADLQALDESILKTFSSEAANIAEIQQVKEYRRWQNKLYDEHTKPELRETYHTWYENDPVNDNDKSWLYQAVKKGIDIDGFINNLKHSLATANNIDSIRTLENKAKEDIKGACSNVRTYQEKPFYNEKLTPEKQIIDQEISKILTDKCS
jgi:hypothetical protein